MYEILKQGRMYNMSIKLQLDLFDKIVLPILLYGCEIWGYGNNQDLEKIHLRFCKVLLNLKQSTPSYMVYGELGRHPVDIDIKIRIIMFWGRLLFDKTTKLSHIVYKLSYYLYSNQNIELKWIQNVKNILDSCGFSNIWDTQNFNNKIWLKTVIKQRLIDQFLQNWNSTVHDSPKSTCYRIFKTDCKFENYFDILDVKDALTFCRFRTTNHKLPIETGRWQNIPRQDRLCLLCNENCIGDEYHYILECKFFKDMRKQLIPNTYICRPNTLKFSSLFTSVRKPILKKLCSFIKNINSNVIPPG